MKTHRAPFMKAGKHAFALALAPLWLVSEATLALTTIREDQTIDASVALDSYQVLAGATLTANGAATQQIQLRPGSALDFSASSMIATGGDALLVGSGAVARVTGSTIVSEGRGIAAARTGEVGSTVELVGSTVTGRQGGAAVASNSRLSLSDSLLRGDGAGSFGVRMFNGQLDALNSQIIGAEQGILVNADAAVAGQAAINLQNTLVEGQAAAAIVVAGSAAAPASAKINVGNGSRLVGSDGTLLEVRNASSADMTVDNAHLVGNVNVEDGSSATLALNNRSSLTGHLDGVSSLSINDQSTWIMTQDASVGDLVLDDGNVQFGQPDAYHRLTVENLSGSGTFVMHADFSTGQTDFLDVTGQATGNHSLLIGSSGKDPEAENQLHVVHAASGDATFSLLNGRVDLGAFSYGLVQRGEDWFLDGSRKVISPGTQSALALFNAAPTVWYGELASLRSRMGELRLQGGHPGAWVRAYGNKFDVAASSGVAYKQVQQGMSFGADAPLPIGDGQWLVGALAGYSRSDLDLSQGTSGDVDSYYLGLYTTWLDKQSGYYFDGVVKLNRFENDAKVALSDGDQAKGDYSNMGVGASAEFGRHIALDNGYFIEPYTQWSAARFEGKDYTLDNGLQAKGDAVHSVLGKLGSTLGRNIDLGEARVIQPYVRAAYAHEFINNNQVKVNGHRFDNDLSGSRAELGVGVAVSMAERLQVHADFDYSAGEHIDQPWGVNLGLRYSW
ncbi:autotransporter outer membrane beta-barrel domain-containing protein [Pseudomonas putida]|uniref:autotransporter outer membrane beta-barrel domain-containing protein n=1 Tax=Pseudomonas putida TaxID=303 RepID=UPI001E64BCD7|nr:autotransporter outer membrane beta-barrel domain-containing protein [Pseudomonas putida]